ncbi:MarR family winged helix-turn-helix transcriptional regulator [Nocardioides currus]|uniref:MarR family winged helix-turn-helix transcriptional regulator n=1 Tax=Nocardioides currus TaxID=2133958 RepID=UPI0014039D37|nr:MarR family transcriptional regulator [Nocardioides currus]
MPTPVDDQTLRSLSHELIRLGRRRDTSDPSLVLDGSAYKILWLVVEDGPQTLRDLAQKLQLEQSTINRQVHAVIARGFAERSSEPGSAAMLVEATAAGEAAYRSDSQVRTDGLRRIVDTLGQDAAVLLAGGLAELNDAIDEAVAEKTARG